MGERTEMQILSRGHDQILPSRSVRLDIGYRGLTRNAQQMEDTIITQWIAIFD